MGTGGEAEALDGCFQDFFAVGGDGAVFADQLGRHLGIGVSTFFAAVALDLDFASADHAAAHAGGTFGFHVAAQFFVLHGGDFDVDVDAVEQRAGNFGDVALDLHGRAVAFALGVSEKSTKMRVTSLRYPAKFTYRWGCKAF